MFLRKSLSEAEAAAAYAEGGDLPAELGLEPRLVREPSHPLTDLPIGALALALSGPDRAREVIAAHMPDSRHNADAVTVALQGLIEIFGPGPTYNGEIAT